MKKDYSRAIQTAEEALKVAEKKFGPESPNYATSLNNLASIHHAQGDYDKAEALYKQCLEILENKFWREPSTGRNCL